MLALDLQRVLAFTYAYACLNASWWLLRGDGEDIVQWFLKVADDHRAASGAVVKLPRQHASY